MVFVGDAADLDTNFTYILQVDWGDSQQIIEDPYRFGTLLHDSNTQGSPQTCSFEILGAHIKQLDDILGTHFCVWAPNAQRVSVVGEFNFGMVVAIQCATIQKAVSGKYFFLLSMLVLTINMKY